MDSPSRRELGTWNVLVSMSCRFHRSVYNHLLILQIALLNLIIALLLLLPSLHTAYIGATLHLLLIQKSKIVDITTPWGGLLLLFFFGRQDIKEAISRTLLRFASGIQTA